LLSCAIVADDEHVKDRSSARLVYSTDRGRICPKCGWPADKCKCSGANPRDVTIPHRVVAKLRLEKAGRGGKTVTVVYDLPRNATFLKELCADLKRSCGTGGTVVEDSVELQGDHRERVRELLGQRGFVVKGN
jgi:translation initiation factor 1